MENLSRLAVSINRYVLLGRVRDFRGGRKTVTLWAGPGRPWRSRMMNEPPPSVFALGPFPIEGAPPMDHLVLLLFCPEQGGWHTGVRFEGRWLAHVIDRDRAAAVALVPGPARSAGVRS